MMEYQKRFLRLIENVEKLLKVSIFIFLLLLIISQILVKIPFLQPILVDVVKLEGIAYK